jgi:GH15 family glucan-1,4-alpha-glucosidase
VTSFTLREDGFLPLGHYAALGDGRTVALVGADGSIDWWCVQAMDSDPLFDRLLDPETGGRFSVTPVGDFTVERHYRENSNVLEQVFTTGSGRARVTDSLNSGISGRLPWSELARRVDGLEGSVEFRVEVLVGRRLGRASPWREPSPHGDVLHLDDLVIALRSDGDMVRTHQDDRGVIAELVATAGRRSTLAVLAGSDAPFILPTVASIDARIDRSDQSWKEWSGNLALVGAYDGAVRRSALALKLLLFSPTGSIAAAATTSLPERIGGTKNYDYRYAWVRDVCYTIKAFLRVGALEEAKAAFAWLLMTIRRHGGQIATMYTLDGSVMPLQEKLDLPGYRGSQPVLRGNKAGAQLQLSNFGDLFATAALFVEDGHVLDLATRKLLANEADRCADIWHQKDSGIWELDQAEHYTFSKLGCWTALDAAVSLAALGQIDGSRVDRWMRERDRIRDWIDTECWSEAKRSYTLHAGSDRLDASLLLATRFRFPRLERLTATVEAIKRELSYGPHVYRYSGMRAEEGAFVACGFWLAEAYALLGNHREAVAQMDALLDASSGNLGLLNEQIDPADGAALGNVPQALSHLALIHAACAIASCSAEEVSG